MSRLTVVAIRVVLGVAVAVSVVCRAEAGGQSELAAPFAVRAEGTPIDLGRSKAFPWIGDFDSDGRFDLLIGQGARRKSSGGHLRIYRNLAVEGKPRFAEPTWFDDLVPSGWIPSG